MKTVYVAEYPAIQHRHDNGDIVTVNLRRAEGGFSVSCEGGFRAVCTGCATEFVYRKPAPSAIAHHKSPLLPPVKGNWDTGDEDH